MTVLVTVLAGVVVLRVSVTVSVVSVVVVVFGGLVTVVTTVVGVAVEVVVVVELRVRTTSSVGGWEATTASATPRPSASAASPIIASFALRGIGSRPGSGGSGPDGPAAGPVEADSPLWGDLFHAAIVARPDPRAPSSPAPELEAELTQPRPRFRVVGL